MVYLESLYRLVKPVSFVLVTAPAVFVSAGVNMTVPWSLGQVERGPAKQHPDAAGGTHTELPSRKELEAIVTLASGSAGASEAAAGAAAGAATGAAAGAGGTGGRGEDADVGPAYLRHEGEFRDQSGVVY